VYAAVVVVVVVAAMEMVVVVVRANVPPSQVKARSQAYIPEYRFYTSDK
jgi:hypothetical protein